MISDLRSAHQHRTKTLMKLSESEIFGINQLISSTSLQLHSGTKSDITRRLATTATQVVSPKSGAGSFPS